MDPRECDNVRKRVDYIVELMENLEYVRGKTSVDLAEIWGVAKSTVENYTAEASRRVTADPDEARRDITVGCRRLFKKAVDGEDCKGAKAVGELWATVSGAKAPEKHEVVTSEATPEAAAALVRQKFGEHAARGAAGMAGSDAPESGSE